MKPLDRVILLVEDDLDDELLALRALHKSQITSPVVVARSGLEALDYLFSRQQAQLPELILLDLNMPKMNGIEVLRRIRSNDRTACIPVVILSTSDEEKDRSDCYRYFANSYVRKPIDFGDFLVTMRQLGQYWLGLNQAPPLRD